MTSTTVLAAGWAFAVGGVLLFAPGMLALRLVRLRGLTLLALAPVVSVAAYGIAAIGAAALGVRWGLAPALVGAFGAVAVGFAMRAMEALFRPTPRSGEPRTLLGIAVVAGSLLAMVDVWAGTGGPDSVLQRWDAIYHLSALRLVEQSGSASSLTLGALSYGSGQDAIYPAAWHAFATLLPAVSPPATLIVAASLFAGPVWVLGCAALVRELLPGSRWVPMVTAVLAGVITPTPSSLWVGWGHLPNAAAFAMVPGVVAFVLRMLVRERPTAAGARSAVLVVLLGAGAGLGLTHPNAFLAVVLLAVPALAWVVADFARRWWQAGRRLRAVVVPVVLTALVLAGAVVFLVSPLSASVTGYTGSVVNPPLVALAEILTGWYSLWATPSSALVLFLAPWGAWLAHRRGRTWVLGALLLVWVTYLDAALGSPAGLSGLWYSSAARLSVVAAMITLPLGVIGWADVLGRVGGFTPGRQSLRPRVALGRTGTQSTGGREPRGARLLLRRLATVWGTALVVCVLAVTSSVYTTHRTEKVFDPDRTDEPRFADSAELAMIASVDLDPDARVLGSPFAGTPLLYSLRGQPVVFPVAGQVWSPQQTALMEHLENLGSPASCPAREALGVRYLYQDSQPYQASPRYQALNEVQLPGARLVAEAGTARILELPPC
ncbi:DUF6541 family protein [Ruania albidiflava]|uniref:DUF6541 family protein n=1 Tax=Ruania albidiflava TaxID=366586 RepID=UPI0003B50290|nr:DUF6541 family protein [Ruania albidiflava]